MQKHKKGNFEETQKRSFEGQTQKRYGNLTHPPSNTIEPKNDYLMIVAALCKDNGKRGQRAPEFPIWFVPTCVVCPLAPIPVELFITAAIVRTTQQWFANHRILLLALALSNGG